MGGIDAIKKEEHFTAVSLKGTGITEKNGVFSALLSRLANDGIEPRFLSANEGSMTLWFAEADAKRAWELLRESL